MENPQIIALYLPQFHCIPENDEFWGKGFTDWVAVRNAKPLFPGHQQPRVPLDDNYYDLSLKENVKWQASLAKKYGVYGFGVYHYWFNNEKNLLTKPAEIMRDSDDIETKYFFIWDNGNWKRSWSNISGNDWVPLADDQGLQNESPILIPYILGREKDWENHYRYVSSHFKSNRYIKKDNKPVFCIFSYKAELIEMCNYWDKLAKNDGFDGLYFIFKNPGYRIPNVWAKYSYEPHSSGWYTRFGIVGRILRRLKIIRESNDPITFYDYDVLWRRLLIHAKLHGKSTSYPGAFVSYDDTPRRGVLKSKVVTGETPEKFEKYFGKLYAISKKQNKDYIFLTAWNEWGECAYLEPDKKNGYRYLEIIHRIITR